MWRHGMRLCAAREREDPALSGSPDVSGVDTDPMFRRKQQDPGRPSVDENGVPELAYYTESPDFYGRLHEDALREGDFEKRLDASWGLIANGAASLPQLSRMLHSSVADSREDAAGALAWIGDSRP